MPRIGMENSEPMRMQKGETRTSEQLRRHYEIERRLAAMLRNATAPERPGLYNKLYDELYRLAPDHPQLVHRLSEHKLEEARRNLVFLGRFLTSRSRFLEIGPGDCSLSFEVARRVQEVSAVDICETMSHRAETPANFRLVISDGRAVPVPPQSIDVAFSNQLMEHLHPDDAEAQLDGVYRALAPGGIYICLTPNRLSGPHDISRYFDPVATGFHIKEYTISELRDLFLRAGFSRVRVYAEGRGKYAPVHPALAGGCEALLAALPRNLRTRVARALPLKLILGIRIVGVK